MGKTAPCGRPMVRAPTAEEHNRGRDSLGGDRLDAVLVTSVSGQPVPRRVVVDDHAGRRAARAVPGVRCAADLAGPQGHRQHLRHPGRDRVRLDRPAVRLRGA